MPNARQFINATRTIIVPLVFEENGERKTEDFKVIYKAYSPKLAAEMSEIEKAEGANVARSLAKILVSIPDIRDGEEPLAMSEVNLEQFSAENLKVIYEGVFKDINPTAAPATSKNSPSTSATEPAPQS
jgi:hypothetical protein